jgi:hypothetical protein
MPRRELDIVKIPEDSIAKMPKGSERKKRANRADVIINGSDFVIREPQGLGMRKAKPSEIGNAERV